jgi:hypothetical protein
LKPTYILLNDHSHFLYGPGELIEVDLSLVVDVEKLESLGQETVLLLVCGALLDKFGLQLTLKARYVRKRGLTRWRFFTFLISTK